VSGIQATTRRLAGARLGDRATAVGLRRAHRVAPDGSRVAMAYQNTQGFEIVPVSGGRHARQHDRVPLLLASIGAREAIGLPS